MGIHVGMDDENSHLKEYVEYMDAELEKEKRERELAHRNADIIWNDFLQRVKILQDDKKENSEKSSRGTEE